ncbi:hypothetical protein Gogos_005217, partial [Gossypium gossypioides]|nr:hypothetical protein [Gossypium gossypioides]
MSIPPYAAGPQVNGRLVRCYPNPHTFFIALFPDLLSPGKFSRGLHSLFSLFTDLLSP